MRWKSRVESNDSAIGIRYFGGGDRLLRVANRGDSADRSHGKADRSHGDADRSHGNADRSHGPAEWSTGDQVTGLERGRPEAGLAAARSSRARRRPRDDPNRTT